MNEKFKELSNEELHYILNDIIVTNEYCQNTQIRALQKAVLNLAICQLAITVAFIAKEKDLFKKIKNLATKLKGE